MKIVILKNRALIESAILTEGEFHFKLVINTREKWAPCGFLGVSPSHLVDYPLQIAAIGVEGEKDDAHLIVVPENEEEQAVFRLCTRYSDHEKDQFVAIWLKRHVEQGSTTVIAKA